jgi:hypothetical protein
MANFALSQSNSLRHVLVRHRMRFHLDVSGLHAARRDYHRPKPEQASKFPVTNSPSHQCHRRHVVSSPAYQHASCQNAMSGTLFLLSTPRGPHSAVIVTVGRSCPSLFLTIGVVGGSSILRNDQPKAEIASCQPVSRTPFCSTQCITHCGYAVLRAITSSDNIKAAKPRCDVPVHNRVREFHWPRVRANHRPSRLVKQLLSKQVTYSKHAHRTDWGELANFN